MTASNDSASPRLERARWRADRLTTSQSFLVVVLVLLGIYLPTATYDYRVNIDAALAALPAWNLVENGTLDLSAHREFLEPRVLGTKNTTETDDGLYSNRHGGTILWGALFYGLFSPVVDSDLPFPMFPAAVAASVATALAMGILHLVFRRLLAPFEAIVAALIAGLATSSWAVSADALWTHGPSQLFLALAILAAASERYAASGVAFGAALFVRPYNAIASAVVGLWIAAQRRSLWPAVRMASLATVGLVALLGYNRVLFGSDVGVGGGYEQWEYVDNVTDVTSRPWSLVIRNIAMAIIDPQRGLLLYAPFLLVLAMGFRAAWRVAEPWVRGAALGGVAVLAAQFWVQPLSQGGSFFFGYRYPIEPLTLAAPLFVLSWREGVAHHPGRQRAFRVAVAMAVSLRVLGAVFEPYKV